jgi:hypothetical protein
VHATLSAAVIAQDEERRLPECLASLAFCDEIVVVDGGSRDRSVAVARAAGAVVIENPWPGYAAQRNVALDAARGEWILEIDADERVSPALAREIRAFVSSSPAVDQAVMPLRNRFLGRSIGPSARYPQYRLRLFRRRVHRHDERRAVHEGIWATGPVHVFSAELEHLLASRLGEAVADMLAYARLEAAHTPPPESAGAVARGVVARPLVKVAYRLVVLGGWRDGWRGALKIVLEALGDSIVWIGVLRRGNAAGDATSASGHFASLSPRVGPLRVVGVAFGAIEAEAASEWLQAAAVQGVDVALIGDVAPTRPVRARRLDGRGWVALVRAVDAEEQVRSVDAYVAFGPRGVRLLRLLPPHLRAPGSSPGFRPGDQGATSRASVASE